MDILKLAQLIEEISYNGFTMRQKNYTIHEAEVNGIVSGDDAVKLRTEYCTPWRCEDPYNHKFTAVYYGKLFEGDIPNDYNEHGFETGDDQTWDWITFYGQDMEILVYDNEYGLTYNTAYGEWD